MATTNKIVDTRRLAAKGRFGDTEMRNVRGEGPSHVTALEAYRMDAAGIQPSASKKSINPMTGLPEYHGKLGIGKSKHPRHHTLLETAVNVGTMLNPATQGIRMVGTALDKAGVDVPDWITDPGGELQKNVSGMDWEKMTTSPKTFEFERQAGDIMAGGLENLQTQYGQYMGDGDPGFIEREEDIRETKLQDVYDVTMGGYDIAGKKLGIAGEELAESTDVARRDLSQGIGTAYGQLKTTGENQIGKSDFAYSGTIEENVRKGRQKIGKQYTSGMKDIGKQYDLGMEGIGLKREDIALGRTGAQNIYDVGMTGSALTTEKGEADFMSGLRKQMNQMLLDYRGATDETYSGDLLTELNTLFDKYSENV